MNDHYIQHSYLLKVYSELLIRTSGKTYKMIWQVSHFSRPRDKKG